LLIATDPARRGLNNVQALRAAAASLVVFQHLDRFLPMLGYTPFGSGGVDLFFVISGFIMVHTTLHRPTRPAHFLLGRITRIVPLYWLATLAVWSVALIAPALLRGTSADPFQLLKSLFFVPFVKNSGEVQPVLFVGWTLNLEMFFYALFAMGLTFANRRAGILSVVAILAGVVAAAAAFQPRSVVAQFYAGPMLLEFAGGMLFGLLAQPSASQPESPSWRAARIGICIGALLAIVAIPGYLPALPRVITAGIPAVVCVAAAVFLNHSGTVITNRTLLTLGDASYSIYLTHAFVTQAMQTIGSRIGLTPLKAAFLIPCTLGAVCVSGVLVHYILEIPLTRAAKRLADWIQRLWQPELAGASTVRHSSATP
jgi:exopolysaccharide production protein ExoZ